MVGRSADDRQLGSEEKVSGTVSAKLAFRFLTPFLVREVRLAPSEAVGMQIAAGMLEENIKKGWDLVSKSGATGGAAAPAEVVAEKSAATAPKVATEASSQLQPSESEEKAKPKAAGRGKKKAADVEASVNEVAAEALAESSFAEAEEKPAKKAPKKKKATE